MSDMINCYDCDGTGTIVLYNDKGEPEGEADCPDCEGRGCKPRPIAKPGEGVRNAD